MNTKLNFTNNSWNKFDRLLVAGMGALLLLCLTPATATAQTYKVLHNFGTNVMGLYPHAPLVQGPDGALYGTTENGGAANRGQVFKVNPDGSGYTVLKDFTGSDGAYPDAGLVLSGTTLYGTTAGGGGIANGTVFKLNTDGSGYTVLKQFNGDDEGNPYAGLVLSGTTLYGTTPGGGSNGYGTVFKVNTDGSNFAVVKYFMGEDGAYPLGVLELSGTTLYGTTANGGSFGSGTVFKINTDGSGYAVLKSFTGGDDAGGPSADLVLSGTTLYGTAGAGRGPPVNGVVFAINTDGSGFAVLKYFTNTTDGVYPNAGLLLSGTTLYGTTIIGGSDFGTVFKLNTDGSDFSVVKAFTGYDGANPSAGLMLSGTTLYGTTTGGGNYGVGTVFTVETDGSGYTVVTHFAGGDGVNPNGSLVLSGTTLYGATGGGGRFGAGTIFKINADGTGYTVLKEFNGDDASGPNGGLVLSGSKLYGTTVGGGTNGSSTVFQIDTDGSGFITLYGFSAAGSNYDTNADGFWPQAGLVLEGTTLYGTAAYGGSHANGTVFRLNTDGSDFRVLKAFTGYDGANPSAGLVLSGTKLYGTAGGGSKGWGTVFSLETDGSGYALLREFGHDTNGAGPKGLVLSGTRLYGTTAMGGWSTWLGTVYELNTDGTGFSALKSFEVSDGGSPYSSLLLSGTTLYGTTTARGALDFGTVFQIGTDGSGFAVLKDFTGSDGANANGGLVLSGTTLYGLTGNGGSLGSGVLFSLSLPAPTIITPPQSQTTEAGSAVGLRVDASGSLPLFYVWYLNDTNLISSSTNRELDLTNVQLSQAGAYTVVVSNVLAAATSSPAMLNVIAPVERRPVPGVKLTGETGSLLNVDYAKSLNPTPNWTTLGSVSLTSTSQYYFDLTLPLPPQRFYRAWQTGTPGVRPSLDLHLVPAITLTGNIGGSMRVDYINQFGPIDAWVTLATVPLTNTSQLYFDISAPGQPQRLYRLVPLP